MVNSYNSHQYGNPQFQRTSTMTKQLPQRVVNASDRYATTAAKLSSRSNLQEQEYYGNLLLQKMEQQEHREVTEAKNKKKRTRNAVLLTLGTVVGLAAVGNLSSNKMAELGQKVDDLLVNQKWYQNLGNSFKNGKSKVKGFFLNNKNKFIRETSEDFAETYTKRHATNKLKLANGYGRGFESIFSLTPPDILRSSLKKVERQNPGQAIKSLEKLVGKDKAQAFYDQIFGEIADNRKFCNELTDAIAENFGAKNGDKIDTKKLLKVFEDMQTGSVNGVDLKEFTNIVMNGGEDIGKLAKDWSSGNFMGIFGDGLSKLAGDWSSVIFIDKIGEKVARVGGRKWNGFCRGNLGDSLVKVNAVNGNLAQTGAGSFVQKCITVPTESISNFVNDKSNVGIGLGLLILTLYKNVLQAPKEKKVATVADDFISTMGALAISTPLAFAATYKLASLGNLEGKTWLTKALKYPGKIFNLGLKQYDKNGKVIEEGAKTFGKTLKNGTGHVLRFALIMGVFSSLFSKPIRACVNKVFGKPYDSTEAEAQKQQQKMLEQQEMQQIYAKYIESGGLPPQNT